MMPCSWRCGLLFIRQVAPFIFCDPQRAGTSVAPSCCRRASGGSVPDGLPVVQEFRIFAGAVFRSSVLYLLLFIRLHGTENQRRPRSPGRQFFAVAGQASFSAFRSAQDCYTAANLFATRTAEASRRAAAWFSPTLLHRWRLPFTTLDGGENRSAHLPGDRFAICGCTGSMPASFLLLMCLGSVGRLGRRPSRHHGVAASFRCGDIVGRQVPFTFAAIPVFAAPTLRPNRIMRGNMEGIFDKRLLLHVNVTH